MALQLAPDEQVEFLIRSSQLDVGLQRDRVVALRKRIEELVHGDRLSFAVARGEVLALEHARHGVLRSELDHAVGAERLQPFGVERDLGLVAVEDQEHLIGVGLCVRVQLFARERRARDVASRRIADHPGEVADQKDDVVPEVLELPELVELNGVAEVQVGPRRVEAFLDAQRLAALELRGELHLDDQLVGAALEDRKLMSDVRRLDWHGLLLQSADRAGGAAEESRNWWRLFRISAPCYRKGTRSSPDACVPG